MRAVNAYARNTGNVLEEVPQIGKCTDKKVEYPA